MDSDRDLRFVSRRTFLAGLASAAVAGLLAACGGTPASPTTSASSQTTKAAGAQTTSASAAPASGKQELTIAAQYFSTGSNSGDVAELDPARRGTWGFNSLLWCPLVAPTADAKPDPAKSLATSWDASSDGKVYTFKLRPDAKFSDGTPITAKDVVDTVGYFAMMGHKEAIGVRDNFGSAVKRLLYDVEGIDDAVAKAPYDPFGIIPVSGVTAPDDHTVQITLTASSSTFVSRVLYAFGVFHPADLPAAKKLQMDQLDFWPAHTVQSGPYKLSNVVPGDHYELVPNEHYFGPKPQLTKITVKAVGQDPNTLLTVFSSGQLDAVAIPLQGATAQQALSDQSLSSAIVPVSTWSVQQLWMTPNVPLDDEHVRRAFTMAVDRAALLKILNANAAKPLYQAVNMHRNPAVPACQEQTAAVKPLPFDPAQAKAELQKSSYASGVTDMEINILSMDPTDLVLLQAVQKMLQDNLGLTNIKIHTEKVANLNNPPFKLHLWPNNQQPWFANIADTLWNMAFYVKDKPWQPSDPRPYTTVGYEPELEKLIDQARQENDESKRCALIQQAGQMWNDVAFSLDYAVPVAYYLVNPRVKDLTFFVNGTQGLPIGIEKVTVTT